MTWRQCIFGKLVGPDGTVLAGCEHNWTGYTSELPEEVRRLRPSHLGIGIDDRIDWSDYPWRDARGALALRPLRLGDHWHLLAARVRGRQEKGNIGRYYTQACYLLAPLETVRDIDLFCLPQVLKAEPMHKQDFALTPVAVQSPVDPPLPAGWFDQVRPLLEPLVSGREVAVQDWDSQPDDFFRVMLWCMACLPAAIRWRVPLGVGLYKILADYALGHGMTAVDGVRRIRDKWKGIDDIDLSAGKWYADWIAGKTTNVTTVSQLHTCVEKLMPELKPRMALEGNIQWQEAVKVLQELRLSGMLVHWLQADAKPDKTPICRLQYFQEAPIAAAVQALRQAPPAGVVASFISELSSEIWKPGWRNAMTIYGPSVGVVGMLLGQLPVDPELLCFAFDLFLPENLHETISQNLSQAMELAHDQKPLRAWGDVISRCGAANVPRWLTAWRDRNLGAVLWKGFEIDLSLPGSACLQNWCNPPPPLRALLMVMHGQEPPYAELRDLVQTIGPSQSQVVLDFVKVAVEKRLLPLCAIIQGRLEKLGIAPAAGKLVYFVAENLPRWSEELRRKLALAFASTSSDYRKNDTVLKLLLILWNYLPKELAQQLQSEICFLIGADMALILFGVNQGPARGQKRAVAVEALHVAMNFSQAIVGRVLATCLANSSPEAETALAAWLEQADPSQTTPFPFLQKIIAMQRGTCRECPSLELAEALLASCLCLNSDLTGRMNHPLHVENIGQLRAVVSTGAVNLDKLKIPLQILASTLSTALRDQEERLFWTHIVQKRSLADRPYWRLLGPSRDCSELCKNELHIVSQLSDEDLVRFVLEAWPIPQYLLGKLHYLAMFRANLSYPQARRLLQMITDAQLPELAFQLVLYILHREHSNGEKRELIEVLTQMGSRGFLGFRQGNPAITARGWARMAACAVEAAGLQKPQITDLLEDFSNPDREIRTTWYKLKPQ